jgi:hypothetical protein
MEDHDQAPPASTPSARPEDEAKKKAPTVDEHVKKHLDECAELEQAPEEHLLISEHATAAGLQPWQVRVLMARFHAHGMRHTSRIHPEVFQAALHEALHGRV